VSQCSPHLNWLRLRRETRIWALAPKMLRGIAPSARSGWNPGGAS